MSITTMRNHSWNPHPLLKERGSTFQKLVGGQNFLLEREDKPEKGVDVEMGRGGRLPLFLLLYGSVRSHLLCVGGSKVSLYYFSDLQSFELAMQDFHPRSHSSLLLKLGIICTFLIHSGSLQIMLTALFNLV